MIDLKTGIEIELLLPAGMGRFDLLDALASRFGGTVERFDFPSKIPVPSGLPPAATIALIQDIARHHEAQVRSISPDFRFVYLSHRAGRVNGLSVVHDNTLAGGERVAEIVSSPMLREDLPAFAQIVAFIRDIPGVEIPETAALHVHVDGTGFQESAALICLIEAFEAIEPALRASAPVALRRAATLPSALLVELRDGVPWRDALRAHVPSRAFALNLYNLIADEPHKLTVELKLAGATLDPAKVLALREMFVALAAGALAARLGPE